MTRAERLQVDALLKEHKRLLAQQTRARELGATDEVLMVYEAAKAERLALIRKRLGVAHG